MFNIDTFTNQFSAMLLFTNALFNFLKSASKHGRKLMAVAITTS